VIKDTWGLHKELAHSIHSAEFWPNEVARSMGIFTTCHQWLWRIAMITRQDRFLWHRQTSIIPYLYPNRRKRLTVSETWKANKHNIGIDSAFFSVVALSCIYASTQCFAPVFDCKKNNTTKESLLRWFFFYLHLLSDLLFRRRLVVHLHKHAMLCPGIRLQ
jgi:hypothetical protein